MVENQTEDHDVVSFVIRRAKLISDKIPEKVKQDNKINDDSFVKVNLLNPTPDFQYERLNKLPSSEFISIFKETGLNKIDIEDE